MVTIVDWKDLPRGKEKYAKYLASREWAVKKRAVRERSKGTCERCHRDRATQCHHMDYTRLYNEAMEDLLDVCDGCHRFISKDSDFDPVAYFREVEHDALPYQFFVQHDTTLVVQCPVCKGEFDSVRLMIPESKKSADGLAVVVAFTCDCGSSFNWNLRTRKGSTYLEVDAPFRKLSR